MKRIFKSISPHSTIRLQIAGFSSNRFNSFIRSIKYNNIILKFINLTFCLLLSFPTTSNMYARDTVKIGVLQITMIDSSCERWKPTA
ncbi:MAG: hypothetical protein PHY57_15380, partial [Ignavibacterium sp.]|nr:hypothetical protein [Ignavibacterium sp.]